MTRDWFDRPDDDLRRVEEDARHHAEYAESREVIHPACTHTERANVLSLPSMGNPFMCRECWDLRFANRPMTRGHRDAWETRSDYRRSGKSVWLDTTRGTVQIAGPNKEFWK